MTVQAITLNLPKTIYEQIRRAAEKARRPIDEVLVEAVFEWIEGGTVIRGKTPKGRATVAALNVNHPDMVSARRLWAIAGWHPSVD